MRVPRLILLVFCLLFMSVAGMAATRSSTRVRRTARRVRRVVYFSPVKGSHESLLRQNQKITEEDLPRIQDDAQLEQLELSGELVRLPDTREATFDKRLPDNRQYSRPWTRKFIEDLAADHYAQYRHSLIVTSAVRTVEFQRHLMRHNHNAAAEAGETASPHLSGSTIDIGKRGMSRKELTWMRNHLLELQNAGVIDVEEEFKQAVFHITVYRDYDPTMPQPLAPPTVAAENQTASE